MGTNKYEKNNEICIAFEHLKLTSFSYYILENNTTKDMSLIFVN